MLNQSAQNVMLHYMFPVGWNFIQRNEGLHQKPIRLRTTLLINKKENIIIVNDAAKM